VPLVASAYGFCQVEAKTDDHYFLGFPSYWNIVAFYLYVLKWPSPWPLSLVLALSVLTFVPTRYLYTTTAGRWSRVTNSLSAAWLASLVAILWRWNSSPRWLAVGSLAFPIYYMAASWAVTIGLWGKRSG
jgi:phosphatidylcholine synthase